MVMLELTILFTMELTFVDIKRLTCLLWSGHRNVSVTHDNTNCIKIESANRENHMNL